MSTSRRELRVDLAIAGTLALAAAIGTATIVRRLVPAIGDGTAWDVWLGADCPRVIHDLLHRTLHRESLHPFFSLLTFPPVFVLRHVLPGDGVSAVWLLVVTIAAIWIVLLYALLRLLGLRRLDALLFSAMGAASAAATFWLPIPETYPLGSVTALAVLVTVALSERRELPLAAWVGVVVLSVSVTVTNLLLGVLAVVVKHPAPRALVVLGLALLTAAMLWVAEHRVFIPERTTFTLTQEGYFVHAPKGAFDVYRRVKTLACQPIVMSDLWLEPRTWIRNEAARAEWPNALSTSMWHRYDPVDRAVLAGAGTWWGGVAVMAWGALLALGLWGLVRSGGPVASRVVIGVGLVGQLTFHFFYGALDSFLFALNYLPLLIAVTALATRTRARPLALVLAGLVTIAAGINNRVQLGRALDSFDHHNVVVSKAAVLHRSPASGVSFQP